MFEMPTPEGGEKGIVGGRREVGSVHLHSQDTKNSPASRTCLYLHGKNNRLMALIFVLCAGYMIADRVLRPAEVGVTK